MESYIGPIGLVIILIMSVISIYKKRRFNENGAKEFILWLSSVASVLVISVLIFLPHLCDWFPQLENSAIKILNNSGVILVIALLGPLKDLHSGWGCWNKVTEVEPTVSDDKKAP